MDLSASRRKRFSLEDSFQVIGGELSSIFSTFNLLVDQCNRTIVENEVLKKYGEQCSLVNKELCRYREIAVRLESIISTIKLFLPPEQQYQIDNSVFIAKKVDDARLRELELEDQQLPECSGIQTQTSGLEPDAQEHQQENIETQSDLRHSIDKILRETVGSEEDFSQKITDVLNLIVPSSGANSKNSIQKQVTKAKSGTKRPRQSHSSTKQTSKPKQQPSQTSSSQKTMLDYYDMKSDDK